MGVMTSEGTAVDLGTWVPTADALPATGVPVRVALVMEFDCVLFEEPKTKELRFGRVLEGEVYPMVSSKDLTHWQYVQR